MPTSPWPPATSGSGRGRPARRRPRPSSGRGRPARRRRRPGRSRRDPAGPRPSSRTSTSTRGARTARPPGAGVAGVLGGVGERLLDDPERGEVDAGGQRLGFALDAQLDREARSRARPTSASTRARLGCAVSSAGAPVSRPSSASASRATDSISTAHSAARSGSRSTIPSAPAAWIAITLTLCATASCSSRATRMRSSVTAARASRSRPRSACSTPAEHLAGDEPLGADRSGRWSRGLRTAPSSAIGTASGMERGGVARQPGGEQRGAGDRLPPLGVGADRVARDDQGEGRRDGERVEVQDRALERDRGQDRERDDDGAAAPPQQRGGDRRGQRRPEGALAVRRPERQLDRRGDEDRRRRACGRRTPRRAARPKARGPARGARPAGARPRPAGASVGRLATSAGRLATLVGCVASRSAGVVGAVQPVALPGSAAAARARVRGRGREAGRLGVAAQHAEHAPHVGERLAGRAGDPLQQLARPRMLARVDPAPQLLRVADDRSQSAGRRGLEVERDAHALLLGGEAGGDLALALAPVRPRLELALQRWPGRASSGRSARAARPLRSSGRPRRDRRPRGRGRSGSRRRRAAASAAPARPRAPPA